MPFRFPSFPVPFAALAAAVLAPLALGATACTSTDTTTTATTSDDSSGFSAALLLRPSAFVGDTPCGSAEGAMRSYVATLTDHLQVIDEKTGLPAERLHTFPSSLPVSCGEGVRFDGIVGGHFYSAHVDGYEAFSGEIGPEGWLKSDGTLNYGKLRSGSIHMTDEDGAPVAPRWVADCGKDKADRTVAAASGTTLILGCGALDLAEDAVPGPTAVVIDPRDALGTLACKGHGAPGQKTVASFDVASNDGLGDTLGLPCSEDIPPVTITIANLDKLGPSKVVSFYVGARAADPGALSWGATCTAIVAEGLTVRAACHPLTAEASLEIDFAEVLAEYSLICGANFATYDAQVTVGEQTFEDTAIPCEKPHVYKPVLPGDYEANLSVPGQDGAVFEVTCKGHVEPGRNTLVTGCTQP